MFYITCTSRFKLYYFNLNITLFILCFFNICLGKEIQLKHRAPVISISVIDHQCSSVDIARSTDQLMAPHKVIITSEEQIKVFSYPFLINYLMQPNLVAANWGRCQLW